jgi:DNA mismatch repair ATPase MutS
MSKRISQGGADTENDLKVVRREVAQIYSVGTFFKVEGSLDFDTKYVLSYYQDGHKFGFCYFDISTLKFYIGSFEDDFTLKQFRTLCL